MTEGRPQSQADGARGGALGWVDDIERATLDNESFRSVLFTGEHLQLTVMRLAPGEEIGLEAHPDRDQFIRVEAGTARLELGPTREDVTETHELEADWVSIISAGSWHNVVNNGAEDVKLYSLYAPPEHPPGTVHRTKADSNEGHDH